MIRLLFFCAISIFTRLDSIAQKTAAVSFITKSYFIDSTGKNYDLGDSGRMFYYADSHRQVQSMNGGLGRKREFDQFQKGKLQHHDSFTDFDSSAVYDYRSYKTKDKGLYKRLISPRNWLMTDSFSVINGYKVQMATFIDIQERLHKVFFTSELADYKIRYLASESPGFVIRYEIYMRVRKGMEISITTATDIEFYDEAVRFPEKYAIFSTTPIKMINPH